MMKNNEADILNFNTNTRLLTDNNLEHQLLEMQKNLNQKPYEGTGQFSRLGNARISYAVGESSVTPSETINHSKENSQNLKGKLFYQT